MNVIVGRPDSDWVRQAFPGLARETTTTSGCGVTTRNLNGGLPTTISSDARASSSVDEQISFAQHQYTPSIGDAELVIGGPAQPTMAHSVNMTVLEEHPRVATRWGDDEDVPGLVASGDVNEFDDGSHLPCPHTDPEDRWVANPQILRVIREAELSKDMQAFLRLKHRDARDPWRPFGYNASGNHVIFTVIEEITKRNFGDWHADRYYWSQYQLEKFVEAFWDETVRLTTEQYGTCTIRSHTDRPANNTPLMKLAKWGHPTMSPEFHQRMVTTLVFLGQCEPGAVDNRNMNAFMHACGAGNRPCVGFFFDKAKQFRELGFNFDQRNDPDRRNALGVVFLGGADEWIKRKCEDLCKRGFMTAVSPAEAASIKSSAHRRNRHRSKTPKSWQNPWVDNPPQQQAEWQNRGQQQPVASRSSWEQSPELGAASSSSSWANRASSSSSWVGNPEVNAAPLLDGASG